MSQNKPTPASTIPLPSLTALTEGEYLVGISFNPGNHTNVDKIKRAAADLIDMTRALGHDNRCTALAVTAFEEGAMWAVKSTTKPPRPFEDAPSSHAPAPSQLPE